MFVSGLNVNNPMAESVRDIIYRLTCESFYLSVCVLDSDVSAMLESSLDFLVSL